VNGLVKATVLEKFKSSYYLKKLWNFAAGTTMYSDSAENNREKHRAEIPYM
jgi:hypothetical protein